MTSSKFLRPLSVLLTTPVLLVAQCELQWRPSSGYPGADAPVRASTCWDPDGSGPIAEVAVVAGDFTVCGDAIANGIAMQSPSGDGWLPLGDGIVGSVRAVLPLPGGELIAAGTFAQAGGLAVANVARWSGGQWSALGTGIGGAVNALARLPNGDLVAGGEFTTAGGAAANFLARWDGAAWHPFGAGTDAAVAAMAVGLDGTLYVGGPFWSVDGVPAAHIAAWRNGVWTEPGGGVPAYGVFAMCILPNGDLVIGYHNLVARWNGLFWSDLQVPRGNSVVALRPGSAGEIWCGTSQLWAQLLRWQAGSWTACVRVLLPMGNAAVRTVLPLPSGEVLVGGTFTGRAPYGPQPPFGTPPRIGALQHLLRWDGQQAHALGGGFDASVTGLAHGLADDILACGRFEAVGSDERRGVARWSGGSWRWAGAAPINPSFPVAPPWEGPAAIGALANGDLAVAGCFTEALPSGSFVNYQAAIVSPSSATRLLPRSAPTLVPVARGNAVVRRDDGHLLVGSTQGVHRMSP
ncbi:MAG: hypothetical protein MUC36_20935, partial [Planctomycetes bacterium]|nr:hypothetical protein [Planctomycetota bacterium]